jgi:phosphatidate cytidylyltransferase
MLITRIVTAIALLIVVIPALFLAPFWVWQVVVLAFMVLAGLEWGRMLGSAKGGRLLASALAAAGIIFTFTPTLTTSSSMAMLGVLSVFASLVIVLAGLFWFLISPLALRPSYSAKTGGLPLAFLLLLATWLAVTQLSERGPLYVLSCLLIVWIADTFAYFSGRTFGNKKLAPSISPGKTWAGVYGGIVGVALYFFVFGQFGFTGNSFPKTVSSSVGILGAIIIAIAMTAYSVIGDLYESKLKREVGVKDSGNTLPGHGGVLDRIDAVIAILPICWLIDRFASGRLGELFKLAAQ